MRTGVIYPQTELGGDPGALKAFAQAAEALGFDHLLLYDHVVGVDHAGREPVLRGPYTDGDPFHEVFTAFAWLAGITEQIELTTGVLVLPQRQSALVAKQAAEVDLLSGGRLRLGVGVGWNWVEYEALEMGAHFRRRGRREEEQIALIRRLWTEQRIEHVDTDHRVVRAGILPRPARPIPIWLGGFAPRVFDRAARLADGYIFSAERQRDAVRGKAELDALLAQHGRAPGSFGFESMQRYVRGAACWAGDLRAWREAGGTHASIMTMGAGLDSVDRHIEAIRAWREAVADELG